jgi:putative heme-binding domain-containing protein
VQPGYYAYQCRLTDGTEVFGLIASETANSITFKLPDGTTRPVLRKEIAKLQSTRASLMPNGLEAALDVQKLADLIAFLRASESR